MTGQAWRRDAACKGMTELFTPNKLTRIAAGKARHICLAHCPVVAKCDEIARAQQPVSLVQGGIAYNAGTHARTGPLKYQPPELGHGEWCKELRRAEREAAA